MKNLKKQYNQIPKDVVLNVGVAKDGVPPVAFVPYHASLFVAAAAAKLIVTED